MSTRNRVRFEVISNLDGSKYFVLGLREQRPSSLYSWRLQKMWIVSEHQTSVEADRRKGEAEAMRIDMGW